ncbi:SRPBCC domain-containing protein [Candidatus Saccharibacteria bacterium]|nr:SRPBCC domain-containing protein [Candidatus Saccharibacteria bacterium]
MIEIYVNINAPLNEVWEKWTDVKAVKNWAFASDDWAAEGIENNVIKGGKFSSRNYAKDGSAEFVLTWTYDQVEAFRYLKYTMGDGRKVEVTLSEAESGTHLKQVFEPESDNPEEMQRDGWQAYLNNFKKFVES